VLSFSALSLQRCSGEASQCAGNCSVPLLLLLSLHLTLIIRLSLCSGVVEKLHSVPVSVIATRLARPLLARFVLLDATAEEKLMPHLLTPYTGQSLVYFCNLLFACHTSSHHVINRSVTALFLSSVLIFSFISLHHVVYRPVTALFTFSSLPIPFTSSHCNL
jgi:hypothetical protein